MTQQLTSNPITSSVDQAAGASSALAVEDRPVADVGIAGLGYVGLTLAATLARNGVRVACWDVNRARIEHLRLGRVDLAEPGLAAVLSGRHGANLSFFDHVPEVLPETVFVCTGTPVLPDGCGVDFSQLDGAIDAIAERLTPDTLVVVRSTVPAGTTRTRIQPRLAAVVDEPLLAYSPERTIQGQALDELERLPQVVGANDPRSAERAQSALACLNPLIHVVSSTDAAELVKLVNNSHTDILYGFGNEVAMISEALGLDADEVIAAANADYPRPDLARPGFVGGSCLTKDPRLLIQSVVDRAYTPTLVQAARSLNESVPYRVAYQVLDAFEEAGLDAAECDVLLCGLAYKGQPATDDTRGAALPVVHATLAPHVRRQVVHDFVVPTVLNAGFERIHDLRAAVTESSAVVLLNDHRSYERCPVEEWVRPGAFVYDLWGVWRERLADRADIRYRRLGCG